MIRIFIAIVFATVALAQTLPSFEVASIHPHAGVIRQVGRSMSGPNVTVDAYTVFDLIIDAYNLKDYQVEGASGWMTLDRFDIAARVEGDAAPSVDQVRLMLQNLLAERFQFKFHRTTKEMSVYSAVIGKGGSKLKESTSPALGMVMGSQDGNTQMKVMSMPLDPFFRRLSSFPGIGRPVLDKTGLGGRYDFQLILAPFTIRVPPDPAAPPVTGPSGESLFTAIEEQLGLKLESQKAPMEILVIDQVQRPSEN